MSTEATCEDCLFKQKGKCSLTVRCDDFIIYNVQWQLDTANRIVADAWNAIPEPWTGYPTIASWINKHTTEGLPSTIWGHLFIGKLDDDFIILNASLLSGDWSRKGIISRGKTIGDAVANIDKPNDCQNGGPR